MGKTLLLATNFSQILEETIRIIFHTNLCAVLSSNKYANTSLIRKVITKVKKS